MKLLKILCFILVLYSCQTSQKKYTEYIVADKYEYVTQVKQPDVNYTFVIKKTIIILKDSLKRTMSIQINNNDFDKYNINDTIKIETKNETQ